MNYNPVWPILLFEYVWMRNNQFQITNCQQNNQ